MFNDFKSCKDDTVQKMAKTVDALKKEFAGLRTGRASIGLLEGIMVDAYGAMTPINQVASMATPESRLISVQVWDKGVVKNVEKAIRDAGLGLNPAVDGSLIRVPIPPLSEERRLELTKIAGKYTENNRVAVRNIRRDAMDAIKQMQKGGKISEDEQKKYEAEVQKATDNAIKELDELLKHKETEIKQV